jgi:hypothetical protein
MEPLLETDLRDAGGSAICSGSSEMQRNIAARWLGLESDGAHRHSRTRPERLAKG